MNKQKLELNELILKMQKALKEAQYSEMRIATFFPTWAKLTEYMTQRNEQILDAKTGLNFLEEAYGITVFKNLPRNLAICARAVNVLTDYQQHGMLLAKARRKVHVYYPQFQTLFQGYIDKRRAEGHSEDTLDRSVTQCTKTFNFSADLL